MTLSDPLVEFRAALSACETETPPSTLALIALRDAVPASERHAAIAKANGPAWIGNRTVGYMPGQPRGPDSCIDIRLQLYPSSNDGCGWVVVIGWQANHTDIWHGPYDTFAEATATATRVIADANARVAATFPTLEALTQHPFWRGATAEQVAAVVSLLERTSQSQHVYVRADGSTHVQASRDYTDVPRVEGVASFSLTGGNTPIEIARRSLAEALEMWAKEQAAIAASAALATLTAERTAARLRYSSGLVDHQPFIAAVIAAPLDDAPRLAYAEWLRQRGDPRGELITRQVKLALEPSDELGQAVQALLNQHPEWEPAIKGLHAKSYRRGFPYEVVISAHDLLAAEDEFFKTIALQNLTLTSGSDEELARIAARPELAHLWRLSLTKVGDAGFVTLARSPHLALSRPVILELTDTTIGTEGMRALAASAWSSSLITLNIHKTPLGSDAVRALGEARPQLRSLWLVACDVYADAMRVLAASPLLDSIIGLAMSENYFGDDGVRALVESPHLGNLEIISLGKSEIRDAGAEALATSPRVGKLTTISLDDNEIGDAGAAALSRSRTLASLTQLELRRNRLTALGADAFIAREGLPALTVLGLSGNVIEAPIPVEQGTQWDGSARTEYMQIEALRECYGRTLRII